MKPIILEVGKPAHGGHCVARHEGRAVFVRHAAPGEIVEAIVQDPDPQARYWMADAVRVVEASPDRVDHPWDQARGGAIGGAELGHVSVSAQRAWKTEIVREAFERFAGVEFAGEVQGAPGDDERGGLRYRTRVSAIADAEGRASMAPHGGGDRVTLTSMPLAVVEAEEALLAARAEPGERIDIAVDSLGNAVIGSGPSSRKSSLTQRVAMPGGDQAYRVRLTDFWQVHREAPEILVSRVLDLAGEGRQALDLYAGVGLFAVALARAGFDVTAVEWGGKSGATSLERNLAGLAGARAVEGDTRQVLRRLASEASIKPGSTIVLDPPRAGAKAATIDAMCALKPSRIVYVACDPVALARDTALLAGKGYGLTHAESWDLFPMTHHIESIACFEAGASHA